jgi:DNA-binding response OmpR family regulator
VFQFYLNQPDLIILDLSQPAVEGRKTLKKIRERTSVPLIALTNLGDTATTVDCLDHGADQCLTKPFDTCELEARVRALIRRSPVRQAAP